MEDTEPKPTEIEEQQPVEATPAAAEAASEAPSETDAQAEKPKKQHQQQQKKVVDVNFAECPETSKFTDEELKTENSKLLDPIEPENVVRPKHSYGGRVRIAAFYREDASQYLDTEVRVCGWAKTLRAANKGALYFVDLNDGSFIKGLQVVVDSAIANFESLNGEGVGTSFEFVGTLIESPKKGQAFELQVKDNEKHSFKVFGKCVQGEYPLAGKKKHTKEYLRDIMHLRPRTNFIGVMSRIRNMLSIATHEFFQKRGFLYVHTPMITASDCEGAGEMFQVTTMLPDKELPVTDVKSTKEGKIDYTADFFKKPAFLTVSGQLSVENFCCGAGDVYTFSPTFRAENSHTKKHLAEFWMIEPELAFADLIDNMDCAEEYIKYCVKSVLENHRDDLEWLEENNTDEKNKKISKDLIKSLELIVNEEFARVSYTDAVKQLQNKAKKAKFDIKPEWGIDLGTEHERFLTEKIHKKPVIVYNYPKDIKAFYMRGNEDGKTVAAMDILVPGIGELVGGAQREERLEVLEQRIEELGLEKESYWWYLELRKFGSIPHSGFGLGFERLILLTTGVENIRDVIPFPRWPGHADF